MAEPGFWDDQEQAQSLINETNRMKEKSEKEKKLAKSFFFLGDEVEKWKRAER